MGIFDGMRGISSFSVRVNALKIANFKISIPDSLKTIVFSLMPLQIPSPPAKIGTGYRKPHWGRGY
jgi:hypothetical protein